MKKQFSILLIAILMAFLFVPKQLNAQSPQKMSYQAVIRDNNNALIMSRTIGMQISILQESSMGTIVYSETQNPTSNNNGLVSLEIGTGTIISGTFSEIDWANGPFFIKTESDPSGGNNYTITGTSQLLSVPYALYAKTSGNNDSWLLNGNGGSVSNSNFIGTITDVPFNIKVFNQKAGKIDNILYNTFYGFLSGNSNTTGKWNTAVGNIALRDNTTGHDNTAIGDETLTYNTIGNFNTALGEGSLYKNTTGIENTATGYSALGLNTTGYGNTANGVKALLSNTTGNRNAAFGMSALSANTTGYFNTANGYHALVYNTTGIQNTSNGTSSLGSNTIGNNNTANGLDALFSNTTGSDNTAVGYYSLFSTTESNGNTALGDNAGNNNFNNGDNNTFLGYNAFADADGYTNSTAIGFNAIITGSDNMILGNNKIKVGIGLSGNSSGPQNKLEINADNPNESGLRFRKLTSLSSTISPNPGKGILTVDANGDVIYVDQSISTSTNNWALLGNTIALDHTYFLGTKDNVPLDFRVNNMNAGRIDNFLNNSSFGYLSSNSNSTGARNSSFGMNALTSNSTGHMNTSIGAYSLFSNTVANGNVAIGESALYLNTSGLYNTAVGRAALLNNITGERNTAIGEGAEVSVGNLSFATAIGSRAYVEQSNSLVLGSINGVNGALVDINVGIGTTKPDSKLHIQNGKIKIVDGTQATGYVLSSDAVGLASWVDPTTFNSSNNNWNLTGNIIGGPNTNFIGTLNNFPLDFRVNNMSAGRIDNTLENTLLGYLSGNTTITGTYNTGIGAYSLSSNTSGNYNTAIGRGALRLNTIGLGNTATGYSSLNQNVDGTANTANGSQSLQNNISGVNNTAMGYSALINNTTGGDNSAIGLNALQANLVGIGNTANGSGSLLYNTSGNYNTGFGVGALFTNTTGSYNTALGKDASVSSGNLTNTTALGYNARVTTSDNMILGNNNVNVGIGLSGTTSGPQNKLEINTDIPNTSGLRFRQLTSTSTQIANPSSGVLSVDSSGDVIYVNQSSGSSSNSWNILGNAGTVDHINFIGTTDDVPLNFRVNNIEAGRIDNHLGNVFLGSASGINTTSSGNTSVGYFSFNTNTTGMNNTALGANSLQISTTGNANTAIGGGALSNNSTGSQNLAIGQQALMSNTTGSQNTALGTNAFMTGTLTNSTIIGYGATTSTSNTISLGNSAITNVQTSGTVTAGSVTYPNTLGTSGQILTVPVSGSNAYWATPTSSSGNIHAIGDSYGGGIVFYVYDGGLHGLIASTADQSSGIQWYNGAYHYTGSTGDGLIAGKMNSDLIVATQIADNYNGNFAAKVCVDYVDTPTQLGDWYLPSITELRWLYTNYGVVGGFDLSANYWSATESDHQNAYLLNFSNNTPGILLKSDATPHVRAIRSF